MIRQLGFIGIVLTTSQFSFGQVTTWREGGENGLDYVLDFTVPEFDLLQTSVVSSGDYAFHLGNPEVQ